MTQVCTIRPSVAPKRVPVSVNSVVIAREAIARETQNHPAAKPADALVAAARALVVRELLLQEARRLGVAAAPVQYEEGRRETEEEALVRALVAQEVTTPEPDDAACRRYHAQNRARFRTPDLNEARHILLAAAPDDEPARETARSLAGVLVAELSHNPDRFDGLAAEVSACPSRATGGNLGQIGPGQTVPEFESAITALPIGRPAVIETRYGVHVVVVDRRIDGRELTYDMVRERIADWLAEKVRRTAIRQYIALLAGRATITGIDLPGATTPLVQ